MHNQGPSACSSNPRCVAAGLASGLCCPTLSGEALACCGLGDDDDNGKASHHAEEKTPAIDPQALCSSNEG